jgi:hypothetical protein
MTVAPKVETPDACSGAKMSMLCATPAAMAMANPSASAQMSRRRGRLPRARDR